MAPRSRKLAIIGLTIVGLSALWALRARSLPHLGAITTVTDLASGLSLEARVDTGAQICSLHYEELEIPSLDDDPRNNVGKMARFKIKGSDGQTAWIEAKLVDHAQIRNTSRTGGRYFVHLPLRVAGVEATVLVNLNNRVNMRYPMLLGRNLLRDRFVVDVRQNDKDVAME